MKKTLGVITAISILAIAQGAAAQKFTPSAFMEILGDANAYVELCDDLSINDQVMQKAALENHISEAVFDDLRNQDSFKNMYQMTVQSAASYTDKQFFCDIGLQEHGKDSPNIPNLLVKKK